MAWHRVAHNQLCEIDRSPSVVRIQFAASNLIISASKCECTSLYATGNEGFHKMHAVYVSAFLVSWQGGPERACNSAHQATGTSIKESCYEAETLDIFKCGSTILIVV
eukprot:121766-Amphidinium_carterae.1